MVHVLHFTTEIYFYPQWFQEEHIKRQYEFIKADLEKARKNKDQGT